jgi:hypothetical protein
MGCNQTFYLACCATWVPADEVACTLECLHLFSFWCVRGSCFMLFDSCAFAILINLCIVRS